MKDKVKFSFWNVNIISEILTLNQEFQFEAWSNNLKCKNLSYICQIDNEGHSKFQFAMQINRKLRSLFQIAIFKLFVKTVKYEKGPYFKEESGQSPYFKQSIL